MGAVEDAVTRLTAQIPSRTVYPYAVPDGTLPARYIVVYGSEGSEAPTRLVGAVVTQVPSIWVTSVSRNGKPEVAAREAAWGARESRRVLRNYSPDGTWAFRAESSLPAQSDPDVAETFRATEQFSRRTYL